MIKGRGRITGYCKILGSWKTINYSRVGRNNAQYKKIRITKYCEIKGRFQDNGRLQDKGRMHDKGKGVV